MMRIGLSIGLIGTLPFAAAHAAPIYISCDFRPEGQVVAYSIDPSQRAIRDAASSAVDLRVVEFTDGRIIFEADNPFYGFNFNLERGAASSSRVTINRVTGEAYASLVRRRTDFPNDLCPADGGWSCINDYTAVSDAKGVCAPTKRKF